MATNTRRVQVHTMGADMTENWKEWEGRTVDGKFLLESYLGGSNGSATFRTRFEDEPAAIKVILLNAEEGEKQLRQWKTAKALNHPRLLRVLVAGSEVAEGGQQLVYAVEELADENLGQIIPERALTAEETRGMLNSVLSPLGYIYDKGLAHGSIRPSNILAVGEEVKLSSSSVRPVGEAVRGTSLYDAPEVGASGVSKAGDTWALGVTLVEVLTQHLPAWDPARMSAPEISQDVAEPFRTIGRRCLEIDPAKRCGLREIRDRLEMGAAYDKPALRRREAMQETAAPTTSSRKWLYWVVAAVVLGILLFLLVRPRPHNEPREESATTVSSATQSSPATSVNPSNSGSATNSASASSGATENAPVSSPAESKARSETAGTGKPMAGRSSGGASVGASSKDEIVERVIPQVAPSARRTITGTVKVHVRVNVGMDGKVTGASLTNPGPSKYFARLALDAGRKWRFAPSADQSTESTRVWNLVFGFTRSRTEASASRAR